MANEEVGVVGRLIKRVAEYKPKDEVDLVPKSRRGIYVLFHQVESAEQYDVVYVGLSRTGMRARLRAHRRSRTKAKLWTHFSVFEVREDVSDERIAELEGLFRQIYRRDSRANALNLQRTHAPLKRLRVQDLSSWTETDEA
jgi:hypothetical protein